MLALARAGAVRDFFHGRSSRGGPSPAESSMIAIANDCGQPKTRLSTTRRTRRRRSVLPAWHEGYLAMLLDIQRLAHLEVLHLRGEARAEALQEIVADTVVAYARL